MHARVYSFKTIKLPLHDRLPNLARPANVGVHLPTQVVNHMNLEKCRLAL